MAREYSDATKLVGGTPLVKINRLSAGCCATIVAKLEIYNPANSVKDRVGVAMVDAAEADGRLKPGGTIVEATSGNTGIALAWVGAARGYRVIIVMPDTMSMERRAVLRAFGAEVVLTPGVEGMVVALELANKIVAETPGAILASQFDNAANPDIHRRTTAEEIWADTDGKIDIFVAGVGTGGTLTGTGHRLKELNPNIKVYAVEPLESNLLSGGEVATHKIQGIGSSFLPEVLDTEIYDEVIEVPGDLAIETARRCAIEEGLLVGISAGAALAAATDLGKRPENAGKLIVCIAPDFGERYVSTELFAAYFDDPEIVAANDGPLANKWAVR